MILTDLEAVNGHFEQRQFAAFCLVKATGETDDEWIVSGPIASANEDYDGDILEKAGVLKGLDLFKKLGSHVDWEHKYAKSKDPDDIVGKGIEVSEHNGQIWLTTHLYKANVLAQKIWKLIKSGAKVGYSILGSGVRDAANPKRIVSTEITMVTLAPSPKGFDQFVQTGRPIGSLFAVAKALVSDPECEGGFCTHVDRQWSPLDKAFESGEGVVVPGDTGGRANRVQAIASPKPCSCGGHAHPKDCKCDKCKRKREDEDSDVTMTMPEKKGLSKSLEQALAGLGVESPREKANAIVLKRRAA